MDPSIDSRRRSGSKPRFWRSPGGLGFLALVLMAGFYVLREHGGHVLEMWPYLLLLACPLMHLMHGHGEHEPGRHRHGEAPTLRERD